MDMVSKPVVCIAGLLIASAAVAQEWTFGPVEKLSSSINSAAEESMPLLSPDGRTLYFTRMMYEQNVGGKYAGQDIWVSEFDGATWGKAENRNLPFENNKGNNAVVGISADGKTIYFIDASPHRKLKGIEFSKSIGGRWSAPELIPIEGLDHDGFVGVYVSPDFDVILISMKGADSKGEEDLYVSLKDGSGRWSKPRNLGPTINTNGFEISPFLTADKKRLFFSSNGHQGYGDGDIFYSERLYDSWETWSVPKNLGKGVNSKKFEGYFCMKDSLVFFCSTRENQVSDVYTSVAKSSVSSTQQQAKKIVEEVKSILVNLNTSRDSVSFLAESLFIAFDYNSEKLNESAIKQLDLITDILKDQQTNEITLISYSEDNDSRSLNDRVSYKRMQSIENYLKQASIPGFKISYELRDVGKSKPESGTSIELRYHRLE